MDRFRLFAGVSFAMAALVPPQAAGAQGSGNTQQEGQTQRAGTGAPQASAEPATASESQGDIIVTAQRRSERLKDVPIALVARDSTQLTQAGATAVRDLTVVTPGMTVSGNGANVAPAIRGIHSDQTDPGNDANVALYVDGVYQSSQLANNIELADVDRVEVLKGPQGTLFGRNATGGAIRVFTRTPGTDLTGSLDVSYGNLNEVRASGYISGPIAGDAVRASVSGYYTRRDGYTEDLISGRTIGGLKSGGVRAKLLLQPTSRLTIQFIGSYVDRRDEDATLYQPVDGRSIALNFPGAIVPQKPRQTAVNQPAYARSRLFSGAAKVDWETGIGTLSSITAYTDVDAAYTTDADFSQLPLLGYPIFERQKDFSQELNFAFKKMGILQLTAGLFYYKGRDGYDPIIIEGTLSEPTIYGFLNQNSDAYAAFGEATITPTDRLSIILGARYSHEKRRALGNYFLSPDAPDSLGELGHASFNSFTPRASIRYTLPSDDNIYFTYSKGFKSGGFSISSAATDAFRPETVDAFEVGLKTASHRVISANISAFYYSYKDQQVQASVNKLNITANAASSRIYGIDADVVIRPAREFSVTLAASWLHARFDSYPNAVVNVPCGVVNCTTIVDVSNGPEPYSPKFTMGIVANYEKEMAVGKLAMSASLYSTDKFYLDNNARVKQPAYATVSSRISFQPHDNPVTFYVYGRNLTDTRYFYTNFISNLGDGVTYATPRTYGVGAKVSF